MKKKFTKALTLILTVCLLTLSFPFSLSADDGIIADDIVTVIDETELLDDYSSNYVEGEVIIMLADTPETETMAFKSLYSDDYSALNQEANASAAAQTTSSYSLNAVGSADFIEEELNLGIEISEMKLLNPAPNTNETATVTYGLNENEIVTNSSVYSVEEEHNNIFSIKLENMSVGEALAILNQNPLIEVAEPNYLYELQALQYDERQYALMHIEAPGAWVSTSGANVAVGIIDTGIEGTHPALENNLWENPYYTEGLGCSVCSRTDDIYGYNFTGAGSSDGLPCGGVPTDIGGHGTHVAGIVAANSGVGSEPCGVAPNAKVVWLGVSDGGDDILSSYAIEAINYADVHNIPILNASFCSTNYSLIFENIINNYDGLFVAAAGNNESDNDVTPRYPASYYCPNIIVVAATNKDYELSSYSNYGYRTVDVVAPGGEEIPENDPDDTNNIGIISSVLDGEYGSMSGTSMASPYVAGIAALIKSLRPSYNAQAIKAVICGTVQDSDADYKVRYGSGIVSASNAVAVYPSLLCTVTFDYNYDGAPTDFIDYVVSGNCVMQPRAIPEREGYLFDGWRISPNNGVAYEFEDVITSNLTLYACWVVPSPVKYSGQFPDYYLRTAVLDYLEAKGINKDSDDVVTESDRVAMTSLTMLILNNLRITDMSGIEYLTGLKTLKCQSNNISSIDLDGLTALEVFNCSYNNLTEVDTSDLISLKELSCNNNSISSIDTTNITNLESLNCSDNCISSLTVVNLHNLKELYCNNNGLTALNVTHLTNLTMLECINNQLNDLNIACSGLEELHCGNNNLESIKIINCPGLKRLYCSNNKLKVLNISNLNNLIYVSAQKNEFNTSGQGASTTDILCEVDNKPGLTIISHGQKVWEDNPFTDVTLNQRAVQYVYENGLMSGTTATTFSPNVTMSRGEMANILYIMAESPSVEGLSNPYTDVAADSVYCDAIKWIYNNGTQSIIDGTSSTAFNPDGGITRENVAVAIYKYAQRNNVTLQTIRNYTAFADESSMMTDNLECVKAIYRARLMDVISGNASGYLFYPNRTMTRIEIAVLIRLFEVCRLYL